MGGEQGGAWDSGLSVNEFAAIRTVGFEPVGQVFGAAVYYLATVARVSCPGTTAAGYFAEAVTTGSAVARFAGRDEATPHASRTVMHLDVDPAAHT